MSGPMEMSVGENGRSMPPVWKTDEELRKEAFQRGIIGDALVRLYIEASRRMHSGHADLMPRDACRLSNYR